MTYQTLTYAVAGRVATITLDRPERMNAINLAMPGEIADAVDRANRDDAVHVLVLTGAGDGFCSGYDLKEFAETAGEQPGSQLGGATSAGDARPWDPMADFFGMHECTQQFMSLWRSYKPTIARVHGPAVAGGSDIALCCDLVIMAEEAVIGYPPARVWGCPTTAMWVYRLGAERAKRMLFTSLQAALQFQPLVSHGPNTPGPRLCRQTGTGEAANPWPRRSCARPAPVASASTPCINFSRA